MIIGISGYIGSGKDTVAKMIQYLVHKQDLGFKCEDSEGIRIWLERGSVREGMWQIKKFAGMLKQTVSLITGFTLEELEQEEIKAHQLGAAWNTWWYHRTDWNLDVKVPFEEYEDIDAFVRRFAHLGAKSIFSKPMTVRELLQKLGTDAMLNQVHPNIHVNSTFASYISYVAGGDKPYPTTPIHQSEIDDYAFTQYIYPNWIISDVRFPNEAQAIKDRGGIVIRIDRSDLLSKGYIVKDRHSSETSLDKWKFDWTIVNDDTLEDLLAQVAIMLKENNLL